MSVTPRPTCCVLYTTDPAYLFPTLVSALQARQHTSPTKADVIIYCLNLDPATREVFAPVCASANIQLVALDPSCIMGQTAMLARLFLNNFVPAHYTDYLYLDGDIHIHGSLDPLIDTEVPEGHFLAANDPMTFLLADKSPLSHDLRTHLNTLGFSRSESLQYFNSGVLRIRAAGWQQIGLDAWHWFERLGRGSRFPDQDALNLAGRGCRLPLSLAWNYPVFLRNSRVEGDIQPRIRHFMSSPKPWDGPFPPWTRVECRPYLQAIADYPELAPFRPGRLSLRKAAGYHLQQNGKRVLESITWGLSKRRDRILGYQVACPALACPALEDRP